MNNKGNFRFGALWIILGVLFLLPSLHLAQAKEGGWKQMQEKIKIIQELHGLNLAPDKAAALLALNQKYAQERQALVGALKKCREDLKTALAAPTPDEAKIKDMVNAANATQDKLLASLKMERDEAMVLMTPLQQGQFIMIMDNWFKGMMGKS